MNGDNGNKGLNLGVMIGELKSDIKGMGKYLGEKIDGIAKTTDNQEGRIQTLERNEVGVSEVKKEKKSVTLYILWTVVIANGISSLWAAFIK